QGNHLAPGHRAALLQELLQGHALDELHGDVQGAPEAAIAQVADDAGMAELVENLVLALEPELDLAPVRDLAGDDLDGNGTTALLVRPPVHHPHGTGAQYRLDLVRA